MGQPTRRCGRSVHIGRSRESWDPTDSIGTQTPPPPPHLLISSICYLYFYLGKKFQSSLKAASLLRILIFGRLRKNSSYDGCVCSCEMCDVHLSEQEWLDNHNGGQQQPSPPAETQYSYMFSLLRKFWRLTFCGFVLKRGSHMKSTNITILGQ